MWVGCGRGGQGGIAQDGLLVLIGENVVGGLQEDSGRDA